MAQALAATSPKPTRRRVHRVNIAKTLAFIPETTST
jgi:hypothetical protein